ncbi:YhdB family protein [Halobacillus litoralis]|uniref:YhdB family protein n=1 Tax=Halobacillus litoralis TaxID=45668 RepID=UPI001CD8185A|nr:YhdB family protein [Halobacillus litoralis]MCA1022637.1 YhdB family protein [Halobacillus litoralis]
MNTYDYDNALRYMIWGQWDDLLVLMVRTNDEFLSKKIETFLHACYYPSRHKDRLHSHEALLSYIDHAQTSTIESFSL